MTDSEKLDLLLAKIDGIDTRIDSLETKVTDMQSDILNLRADVRQLNRNDKFILDEIDRVHNILDKHTQDETKHTA